MPIAGQQAQLASARQDVNKTSEYTLLRLYNVTRLGQLRAQLLGELVIDVVIVPVLGPQALVLVVLLLLRPLCTRASAQATSKRKPQRHCAALNAQRWL